MNVNDKQTILSCTSCQMCGAVCPKSAISISLDNDGFYRPIVDSNLCVDCGMCTNVCYKFDDCNEDFGADKLINTTLYGASAKDTEIVKNTTSGGIADLLAHQLMQDGYKCVGVIYDSENDIAVDRVAMTENELDRFRGSKYIQSYTLDAFKDIVKNCGSVNYAIFGTPCHIYAMDKYLRFRKVRDQHILIDLYCHGCPSMFVWKKYIRDIKGKITQNKIDGVNFRSKIKGWGNFYVAFENDGKSVYYSNFRHNEFFDLFFSDQILNEACDDCRLRSTLAYTDIRLGDFWGKQYVMNNKGVSAVSIVSDNAKELFNKIKDKVIYKEEHYEDFLPWQSWGKSHHPKHDLRRTMLEQLRDNNTSLHEIVNSYYRQQNLKSKLSRYCKQFIHALPIQCEKSIRWLFYKIR